MSTYVVYQDAGGNAIGRPTYLTDLIKFKCWQQFILNYVPFGATAYQVRYETRSGDILTTGPKPLPQEQTP